jgi:hypothetical protein
VTKFVLFIDFKNCRVYHDDLGDGHGYYDDHVDGYGCHDDQGDVIFRVSFIEWAFFSGFTKKTFDSICFTKISRDLFRQVQSKQQLHPGGHDVDVHRDPDPCFQINTPCA